MARRRPRKYNPDPSIHARLRRRWRSWLPTLQTDLSDLLGKREIFWELQEVVQENKRILEHGTFFDWMCRNYIAAVVMGIRGFVDEHRDVRSLWRMIYEILEHPRVINRNAHRALYRGIPANRELDLANLTFDNVVGRGRDTLSQRDIRKDLSMLEDSSARVKKFANKRVAHRAAAGELRKNPKFNDLDAAMDTIDQIFCKYNLLLRAAGMTSAFATRQYNWMEVLYEPWIPPRSRFHPSGA